MKLDVEGMEFAMLRDLIASGALCTTVDFVLGEFHYDKDFYPMRLEEQGLHFNDNKASWKFQDAASKLMDAARSPKTKFDRGPDDESYLHDVMPLPSSAL
jgi:hypothetical protein